MIITSKPAYRYYDTVANTNTGKPLVGYYVQFFYSETGLVATRYTDENATAIDTSELYTDVNGMFGTYLAPDYYDMKVYSTRTDYINNTNPVKTLTYIAHDGFTTDPSVDIVARDLAGDVYGRYDFGNVLDPIDDNAGPFSATITTASSISDVQIVANNINDVTNFADVYYGPSATDPTTRKNLSPLQNGDLYFNTTIDRMKVYSTDIGWISI